MDRLLFLGVTFLHQWQVLACIRLAFRSVYQLLWPFVIDSAVVGGSRDSSKNVLL